MVQLDDEAHKPIMVCSNSPVQSRLCMLDYYIPHCMWFEMPYNLPAGREDLALYNNNEDNLFMWEIQHTNIYKHSGTNRPSRCIREIRGFLLLHNNLYKQKGRCGLWPKCRRVHPKFPTYVFWCFLQTFITESDCYYFCTHKQTTTASDIFQLLWFVQRGTLKRSDPLQLLDESWLWVTLQGVAGEQEGGHFPREGGHRRELKWEAGSKRI